MVAIILRAAFLCLLVGGTVDRASGCHSQLQSRKSGCECSCWISLQAGGGIIEPGWAARHS